MLTRLLTTVWTAVRRRPVRVAEIIVTIVGALGVTLTDHQETQVVALIVAAVALAAGEVAQARTTPLADPRDDLGRPLVASEDLHTGRR